MDKVKGCRKGPRVTKDKLLKGRHDKPKELQKVDNLDNSFDRYDAVFMDPQMPRDGWRC